VSEFLTHYLIQPVLTDSHRRSSHDINALNQRHGAHDEPQQTYLQ